MSGHKLDQIDLRILEILQVCGRTRHSKVAEEVKLSVPSVGERIRKLEEAGLIRSVNAILEARKVGLEVSAFIFLVSESSEHYVDIIECASGLDEVLECHSVTGDGSHLLKIRTHNTATLEQLLSEIQSWPGVTNTRTNIVLSSHKETSALSLSYLFGSEVAAG
tara:strand:+ start:73 stop:564 length:492 start_codon:yes stop_codon:yes gene_type:complete